MTDQTAFNLDDVLPAWEATYEPGNVSDYLIGYANSEAAAKGAALAWLQSQSDKDAADLEWVDVPSGNRHDHWFNLIQNAEDGMALDLGINVRRRLPAPARAADRQAAGQPAAACTCASAGDAFAPAGHYRDCPQAAAEETHVVGDDSDDPEHIDDCPGCATPAAGLAAPANHDTDTEARCCDVQVWPLARVLRDVRCGSKDWTWGEEWADLDKRHAETGYLDTLEQQIRADGITVPVLIGSDGRLWDGHHRLRIAVRLGIPYVPVEVTPRAAGAES